MASTTNGMGRGKGGKEKVVNSGQRPTMGTSIYSMPVDAPSGTEFRNGMLEHRQGGDKSDAPDNRTSKRSQVSAQSALGASYHITPSIKQSAPGPDPRTQANGRIVPSVMGSRRNFWAEGG